MRAPRLQGSVAASNVRPALETGDVLKMDMTGERRIPAPREKVWQGLNDPVVLKASIPGCESLEKLSDTEFKATAAIKIGPIAARFSGKVALTEIDPPNGYRIGGEGQGGVAGFAKGGATVALTDDGTDTLLKYDVQAQVGGKIAQLGARLIDATAKSMAEQFFTRFAAQVSEPVAVEAPVVGTMGAQPGDAPVAPSSIAPSSIAQPANSPAHAAAAVPGTLGETVATSPAVHGLETAASAAGSMLGMPVAAHGAPGPRPVAVPPAAISMLSLIPKEPFGFPIIAWVGAVICFFIYVLIFGSLL